MLDLSSLWLPVWGFYAAILVAAQYVVPTFVFKHLDSIGPMPEGMLRDAIEKIIKEEGIQIDGIMTERNIQYKAYFCGIGKVRKLVISESLACSPSAEVLGIVSHEIGHCLHHDVEKTLVIKLLGGLMILLSACQLHPLAFLPSFLIYRIVKNVLMRRQEYKADRHALISGYGEGLADSLARKPVRKPGILVYILGYTHPLAEKRIKLLVQKINNVYIWKNY